MSKLCDDKLTTRSVSRVVCVSKLYDDKLWDEKLCEQVAVGVELCE